MTTKGARYFPGTIVFMGPNGVLGGDTGRCVEFKCIAPPTGEPRVVVRFDAPSVEKQLDGSLLPISPHVHLTIHVGLHVHLTGNGSTRDMHHDAGDDGIHHLLAVALPLPSCPIAPRDGQRVHHGAKILPYGDPSASNRVVIDVWGATSEGALFEGLAKRPPAAPLAGMRRAWTKMKDGLQMFGDARLWLAFFAWELAVHKNSDPRPMLIWVSCPHD